MFDGVWGLMSDMLTTGARCYLGTRYPGTRATGPNNPADVVSDPDPVAGSTRPGKLIVPG